MSAGMQTILRNQSNTWISTYTGAEIGYRLTYRNVLQVIIKITESLVQVVSLYQLDRTSGNVGRG